jgi:hypothetical protein
MNQSEVVSDLLQNGWMSFMPDNVQGWKFFFKRDPNGEDHYFFGPAYLYLTLFPNNHTAEGIIETEYYRWKRRRAEILFRDFRNYPRVK